MRSAAWFNGIVLFYFAAVTRSYGHPIAAYRTTSTTVTEPFQVPADPTASTIVNPLKTFSRKPGSHTSHHKSSVTIVRPDVGCRKRVICEAARTVTYMFPFSKFWHGIASERPDPKSVYFAAWSRGLSSEDCSLLYPDCSDSPAGVVLSLANQAMGPKGFVSSFIERLTMPAGPDVPREPGAPRPSLVMQKLRTSQRQWEAAGGPPPSLDESTPSND